MAYKSLFDTEECKEIQKNLLEEEAKVFHSEYYNDDCLKVLKEMKDNYVDVTFTSPPYNDKGGEGEDVAAAVGSTHKKYQDVEFQGDWLEWQCEIIDELRRVSKKYVLYNVQALANNRENVYKLIGRYADCIHDIIVWYKPNGTPTSTPHKISNRYEFLLILKCEGTKGVDTTSEFYFNVIVQNSNHNREFSKIHRAVMSKDFSDECIREFTSKGDVVLDPFMGMGTTGVSCKEQGRHFVGIELSKLYYEKAIERIENTRAPLW